MDDGSKQFTYSLAESALKEWNKDRLDLIDAEEGVRHYRFRYTGSTCTNGGTPFNVYLHVFLLGPPESSIIKKAWITIPEEENDAALQMCTAYRDSNGKVALFGKLAQSADFSRRSLEDVLEERPHLNYAGCFCGPSMVREKWNQVLSTIHWREHHGSAEDCQTVSGANEHHESAKAVPERSAPPARTA